MSKLPKPKDAKKKVRKRQPKKKKDVWQEEPVEQQVTL